MIKKFIDFVKEGKYQVDHEMDRILDKIKEHGEESLSPQEKSYLDGERTGEPQYDGTYKDNNTIKK